MMFYKGAFKQLRIEAGLTQDDIAKKVGISKTAVSYWEREDRTEQPRASRAYQLAAILGCSVIDFSDLKPEKWLTDKSEIIIPDDHAFEEVLKAWPKLSTSERLKVAALAAELLEKQGQSVQQKVLDTTHTA
ncbi:helix-turn-helix transcriptional regulator [Victivallis vadensis]|uniref:helix-turn-helix transcriptional regulator n=1 Tax=Victivallis vadensis TaxID=172901 RepID=UPI0023F988D3|nr:helix-turn-helix transcriptional regulator [Victivallis vadensis]